MDLLGLVLAHSGQCCAESTTKSGGLCVIGATIYRFEPRLCGRDTLNGGRENRKRIWRINGELSAGQGQVRTVDREDSENQALDFGILIRQPGFRLTGKIKDPLFCPRFGSFFRSFQQLLHISPLAFSSIRVSINSRT